MELRQKQGLLGFTVEVFSSNQPMRRLFAAQWQRLAQ
jgi:hypothetical protein